MQNRYMKASIISSSIAILTGVLFFGISVTFGAPTYSPSGSENVKPTFSGLNVNGSVKISETNIAAFPNNQVLADATGGLLVLRNDPVNAPKKGIFMDGDDIVSLGQGLSLNAFGEQEVTIGSQVAPSSLDIPGGYIRNSNNGGADPVKILGIKLPGPGDLDVASSSSIKNSTVGFPVKISDPDGLSLSAGDLDMQNGAIKNSTANNFGVVTIQDHTVINGDLGVSGQISSNKKITSSVGFGTYTFRQSAAKRIPSSSDPYYTTQGCNVEEVLVSCFSNAFNSVNGGDFWTDETIDGMILTALYPWDKVCEANYKNTSGGDKWIKVGAMCFDPTK